MPLHSRSSQPCRSCETVRSFGFAVALRVESSELIDASEHLRVHDRPRRALPSPLEQREYGCGLDDSSVDSRWRVPGLPLAELVGAVHVRGPGDARLTLGGRAPEDGQRFIGRERGRTGC